MLAGGPDDLKCMHGGHVIPWLPEESGIGKLDINKCSSLRDKEPIQCAFRKSLGELSESTYMNEHSITTAFLSDRSPSSYSVDKLLSPGGSTDLR